MLFLAHSLLAWQIQPPTSTGQIRAAAGLCIDEFETLPLPFLPLPGWQQKARDEAVAKWTASREALLADSQPHALLVALRDEAEAGRYFEGVDDALLGFAELGLLPAPPEKRAGWPGEEEAAADAEAAAAATVATAAAVAATTTATATTATAAPAVAAVASESALYPYLANLAVKQGARRLGIGKELVRATERKAAELGFDRMYIKVDRQNFDARRVYDRLGFRVVYLQPRTDPRKGPTGANLFLRKDGLLSAP